MQAMAVGVAVVGGRVDGHRCGWGGDGECDEEAMKMGVWHRVWVWMDAWMGRGGNGSEDGDTDMAVDIDTGGMGISVSVGVGM